MRLIDADLFNIGIALYLAENAYLNDTAQGVLEKVAKWLDDAPTVDAVPVVHGRWLQKPITRKHFCSNCGNGGFNKYFVYGARYCPICGARMDLK